MSMRTSRRRTCLAAAIALCAAVVGPAQVGAADDDAVLKIGFPKSWEPTTTNPYDAGGGAGWVTWIAEPALTGWGTDLEPTNNGWAESWSVSDDGLTWTFRIYPWLKWSDGEPATAADVAFTYNYEMASLDSGTPVDSWFAEQMKANIASITATDDLTVEMTTIEPTQWPLLPSAAIQPRHLYEGKSYEEASTTFQGEPPVVTAGPFYPSEWVRGQFMRFTKNPYWGGDQPAIDEFLLVFYQNEDALGQALLNGDVDAAPTVPAALMPQLQADPSIEAGFRVSGAYTAVAFNQLEGKGEGSTPALRDPAFRDALGYAIDYGSLAEKVFHGPSGVSMIAPVYTAWYSDLADIARSYDPEEAKRRLDAAGYPVGSDGWRVDKDGNKLELSIYVPSSYANNVKSAEFLKGWFGEIGVSVNPQAIDDSTFFGYYGKPEDGGGTFDLAIVYNYPYPDPNDYLNPYLTSQIGSNNPAFYSNPQVDDLYLQQSRSVDTAERQALNDQIVRIIYQDAPALFIGYEGATEAYRTDRFTGWQPKPAPDGLAIGGFNPPTFPWVTPVGATASPSASPAETAEASASAAPSATSAPVTPAEGGSGDNTGLLVGGAVLVLVLVGGAILYLRRRGSTA